MSLHIHRFVDSIKAHESRGQRDFSMPMRDAKDLHADITKLLITLEQMREQQTRGAEVVEVQITGGSFKSA
jgi:DNA-binding protein YbaB